MLGGGLSLLLSPFRKKKIHKDAIKYSQMADNGEQHFFYQSHTKIMRRFGGGMEYIRSNDFKRVDIEAHFSGLKVYFDDAVIQGNDATVHLDVNFAGVELFIPCEWAIDSRVQEFAGAVEIMPPLRNIAPTKTLKLKGEVHFGSVKVNYF